MEVVVGEGRRYRGDGEGEQPVGGESASINKQVTPGALQRLELPQRGSIVSGIASAVSLTFKKKKKKPHPSLSPLKKNKVEE